MIGVSGYILGVKDGFRRQMLNQTPIDRDQLDVPEIILEDLTRNSADVLRPVFDAVWNAAALPRCLNYDQDGKWNAR